MREEKTREKKPKKIYGLKEINMVSDLMITFIGLCIIILAVFSLTGKVPKEYTFGATLAGFWFVLSDVMLIEERLRLIDLLSYIFYIFMGIFSFIVIPVMVQIFPSFEGMFMQHSDFFTFMALGFVLALMGVKTILRKKDLTTTRIEQLEKELDQLRQNSDSNKAGLVAAENKLNEIETSLEETKKISI